MTDPHGAKVYTLHYRDREVARGDFLAVFMEANYRGAIEFVTPSQRGYRYNRVLLDLGPQYEIIPHHD